MGHSGDGYDIELVTADQVPKNDKQRLKVLKVQSHKTSTHALFGSPKWVEKVVSVPFFLLKVYVQIKCYTKSKGLSKLRTRVTRVNLGLQVLR